MSVYCHCIVIRYGLGVYQVSTRGLRFAYLVVPVSLLFACVPFVASAQEPSPIVRAILRTTIAGTIGLPPVQAAAQRAGCIVVRSDPAELVLQFAGSSNYAYVRSNGELLIVSAREPTTLEDMDLLSADLLRLYSFIEAVSPPIPPKIKWDCLDFNRIYYLPDPRIYKRLVFPPGIYYDGKLVVPDCTVKQARFVGWQAAGLPHGEGLSRLTFRGRVRIVGDRSEDVTKELVFGQHQLSAVYPWGVFGTAVLEAITAPTNETIQFAGRGAEHVIVTRVLPLPGAPLKTPQEPSIGRGPGDAQPATEPSPRAPQPPKPESPSVSRAALRELAATLDEVVKKLDTGTSPSPGDAKLNAALALPGLWLGEFHLRKNQDEAALPLLEQCVRLAPDMALAHAALARARKAQGDSAKFAEEIGRAVALDPKVPIDEPAVPVDAVTLPVDDVQAVVEHVRAAQDGAKPAEFTTAIRQVDALAHCGLGIALLTENSAGPALEEFRKASAAAPDQVAGRRGCAEAAWAANDAETAVKEIQEAYRLDPKNKSTLATLAAFESRLRRDLTPPTVWFITPHDGDTARSTVQVRFAAEDNLSVHKVTLYVDGNKVDDYLPKLQALECTITVRLGPHTLRLECRDKAGNTAVAQIRITRY